MTNQKKIIFTDKEPEVAVNAEYVAELENKLWEKELEARRTAKRAEELEYQIMKQQAAKKAAERRMMRYMNCAVTLFTVAVTYIWILAAAAGEVHALSSAIPLTVGFSAAFRWGKYQS